MRTIFSTLLFLLGGLMFFQHTEAVPLCGGTVDYSIPDAPKEIRSTEMHSFAASFEGYTLSLVREGKKAKMYMRCDAVGMELLFTEGTEVDYEFTLLLPGKTLRDLDSLLKQNAVPQINGWNKCNTARGCDFSLKVLYASGESISATGQGGAAVLPRKGWIPEKLVSFFLTRAKAHGLNMQQAHETWKKNHKK